MSDWDLKELLIFAGLNKSDCKEYIHSMRLSGAAHVHIWGKVFNQSQLKDIENSLTLDSNIEQLLSIGA